MFERIRIIECLYLGVARSRKFSTDINALSVLHLCRVS